MKLDRLSGLTALNEIIDSIVKQSRPTIVATLLKNFRQLQLAEDAYQNACIKALQHWPSSGIPNDPSAWLFRVAKNAGIDIIRANKKLDFEPPDFLCLAIDESDKPDADIDVHAIKDDVLHLMFLCCHQELSIQDQLALALKILAGLTVEEISRAFLVSTKTMAQRITRAKKKAELTEQSLETPTPQERLARVQAVSLMVYLLFNEGYSATSHEDHIRLSVCEEAIHLAKLLVNLFPGLAELKGLLALLLFQHARAPARLSSCGELISLEQQDRTLWSTPLIQEANVLLEEALRHPQIGPYQVQAAIAAVHCKSKNSQDTDWHEIEKLYSLLENIDPSPVVSLNRAAAIFKTSGSDAALFHLAQHETALMKYLPYHSLLIHIYEHKKDANNAIKSITSALELDTTPQEKQYLENKLVCLTQNTHIKDL